MVTWQELFAFCMVIVAIISLVRQDNDNKKKSPPTFHSNGYFFLTNVGSRPTGSALCIYTIPHTKNFVNVSYRLTKKIIS